MGKSERRRALRKAVGGLGVTLGDSGKVVSLGRSQETLERRRVSGPSQARGARSVEGLVGTSATRVVIGRVARFCINELCDGDDPM